jgi:hypothetical protein
MMVVVTVCLNFQSRLFQFEILMIVFWMSIVYILWISCTTLLIAPLGMGMGSIKILFYYSLIVKLN